MPKKLSELHNNKLNEKMIFQKKEKSHPKKILIELKMEISL